MKTQSFKYKLIKTLSNIPGYSTNRKLIVFESDDWGSIRMPSNNAFNNLIKAGIDLKNDNGYLFNKYDSLATSEDLEYLFDTLSSVQDSTNRPAVITPICVVANPDFNKIQQSGFENYYYEPFTKTLNRYPDCEYSFLLWKKGIEERLFVPQFHGREHLNVLVWMKALKNKSEKALIAFENRMWGITTAYDPEIKIEFQAAFDFINPIDIDYHKEVITSGLKLFEEIFGYRADYFVPPNGIINSTLDQICINNGIKNICVPKIEDEPKGYGKYKKKINWLGKKSKHGLTCITRNCLFEPYINDRDWIDSCLYDISNAFSWKKPAVISTHRINFIGALNQKNRDNGLTKLLELLKKVTHNWPDCEFITSSELGDIITDERSL